MAFSRFLRFSGVVAVSCGLFFGAVVFGSNDLVPSDVVPPATDSSAVSSEDDSRSDDSSSDDSSSDDSSSDDSSSDDSSSDDSSDDNNPGAKRPHRYSLANLCWAVKSVGNGKYVARNSDGSFTATAADAEAAEAFRFKPSALGHYLLYMPQRSLTTNDNEYGDLLTATLLPGSGAGVPVPGSAVTETPLSLAHDGSEWTVRGVGDKTSYPNTPLYDLEPMLNGDDAPGALWGIPNEPGTGVWNLDEYRDFKDPMRRYSAFTLSARNTLEGVDANMAVDAAGNLILALADADSENEQFEFERVEDCARFPEGQSDLANEDYYPQGLPTSFDGTNPLTGGVLGHADIHVHIASSTFLGGGQYGATHGRFGISDVLESCEVDHGPTGSLDTIGDVFSLTPVHDTTGYPDFNEWPSRGYLTHEAIYWKWIERAWQSGTRLIVNELVDNETLCELTRSQSDDVDADCNSQRNAKDQIGTLYSLMDYIDAQYGGPGKGFFRIVETPDAARDVIEDGKIAVVLGLEISNTVDCKMLYNLPERQQEPFEETGRAEDGGVTYYCSMDPEERDKPWHIDNQLQRLWDLGVRKIISIHEFDNAFGGNGIFSDFLNFGNRENSGAQPAADPIQRNPNLKKPMVETPNGEFWTTYECPSESSDNPATADDPLFAGGAFSGYLWGDTGGTALGDSTLPPSTYPLGPVGQGGRDGGPTPRYRPDTRHCNARWMTPIGVYFYSRLMEHGFVFDFDHMEMSMKSQALDLTEAQPVAYPIVSSHGTFGGTTQHQAFRVLRNGGVMYPSLPNYSGFKSRRADSLNVYRAVVAELEADGVPADEMPIFAFGYGTDTNGLSSQSSPRGTAAVSQRPITYPYSLFSGGVWDQMPEFENIAPVTFDRPGNIDPNGNGRVGNLAWHQDEDGNAHYGMMSGLIQEAVLEAANDVTLLRDLFNSAEGYLRAWQNTVRSRDSIQEAGGVVVPPNLLRRAPVPNEIVTVPDPTDCAPANSDPQCVR